MRFLSYEEKQARAIQSESGLIAGEIVSRQPGTNYVDVRLINSGNRVVRRVLLPYYGEGITFEVGQIVLIAKTLNTGWVLVCAIQDRDSYGVSQSTVAETNTLFPPNSISVTALGPLLILAWEGFAGRSLCYQVNHAVSILATGELFLTRGSYFLYPTTAIETRYFRVRTVSWNTQTNQAYYSSYSEWVNATSSMWATQTEHDNLVDNLTNLIEHEQSEWDKHYVGE